MIAPTNTLPPATTQETLSQISQQQTPPATPVPINAPNSQTEAQQALQASPPVPIQQTLSPEKHNKPWGDITMFSNPTKNFRVLSKNTGTLNLQECHEPLEKDEEENPNREECQGDPENIVEKSVGIKHVEENHQSFSVESMENAEADSGNKDVDVDNE